MPNEKNFTYRLAGSTCYAGDIFGDYSFNQPLDIGSKIIFMDTAPYTMVKSNKFNGIKLPSYKKKKKDMPIKVIKQYNYDTFLSML